MIEKFIIIEYIIDIISLFFEMIFVYIAVKSINEFRELHNFSNRNLPVITIGSPCDPRQGYCEINLIEDESQSRQVSNTSIRNFKGTQLFSIANFTNTNAYHVDIKLSTDEKGEEVNYELYFQEISKSSLDSYSNYDHIYTKYNIKLNSEEKGYILDNSELDICSILQNCSIDKTCNEIRYIYIHTTYYSLPNKKHAIKIKSVFKVGVKCNHDMNQLNIVQIARISYEPEDQNNFNWLRARI